MSGQSLGPSQLFDWLARLPERRHLSLECGAGTGEATAYLSRTFHQAVASDFQAGCGRLAVAEGGQVLCAAAESLPFKTASLDLLFSLQAFHRFDAEAHCAEARRVLRPGGVFAALSWGEILLPDKIARTYAALFEALSPYWEAERPFVLSGYRGLALEGEALRMPRARLRRTMTLEAFEREIAGWSAFRRAVERGIDLPYPSDAALDGIPDAPFEVAWPLLGQVFRR